MHSVPAERYGSFDARCDGLQDGDVIGVAVRGEGFVAESCTLVANCHYPGMGAASGKIIMRDRPPRLGLAGVQAAFFPLLGFVHFVRKRLAKD
jgi:hypothetical protein